MEQQPFLILCGVVALGILASIPRAPGGMIGFLFGVSVAFFVAPAALLLGAALRRLGVTINPKHVALGFLALWCMVAAYRLVLALIAWDGGNLAAARLVGGQAIVMIGVLAMGWFSSRALVRAWP